MAELRNIDWKKFIGTLCKKEYLDALRKSKSLQWWFTLGFRDNGYMLLDDLDGLILEYKGIKFYPDVYNYARMFEAWDRYRLDRIQEGDVVLDLGANIGSFTLPAAKIANRVIAVEPLFHGGLRKNVELNGFTNVEILPYAIGTNIVDAGLIKAREVEMMNLASWHLSEEEPQIDVVRMDIGGAEWKLLSPWSDPELSRTRQWEIEFHFYKGEKGRWEEWREWFENEGYGYIARWSKHRHWLYVSADKDMKGGREVQLGSGSFRGRSLQLWRNGR